MKLVNSDEIQWHTGPGHRESGLFLRDVLVGEEGKPGNYWLAIIKVTERYDTPPHMHNFDQVRIMLEGAFNFGDQDQAEGTIGYFSEGTSYTQNARGESVTLLLQCEGGSQSRYASQSEFRVGVRELIKDGGEFKDGRYRGPDPITGEIVDTDSYEAVWQQIAGQRLEYPKARYQNPVIMDPSAYAYGPVDGCEGTFEKNLGQFNERQTAIAMWKFELGGARTYSSPAKTLLFVKSGVVAFNDQEAGEKFAVEILPDEIVEIRHIEGTPEIIVLRLPS